MKEPTLCQDLILAPADFGGYCNVSQSGVVVYGLIWLKASHLLFGG